MVKFSFVRIDNNKDSHLTVRSAEWLMERMLSDTKAGDIAKLRDYVMRNGVVDGYDKLYAIAEVYPSVELAKTENGRLEVRAFNSLITLHVADLMRQEEVTAVKEAAKLLPMTFAAFTGADGRSVEILVAVASKDGVNPTTEDDMNTFCRAAYNTAFGVFSGILPKPIDRQAVSARHSFLLPLDPAPFYNPSPTPLLVSVGTLSSASVADSPSSPLGSEPTVHSSPSFPLYAAYEQMYERASEKAYQDTEGVIADQWYEAYLTALAHHLCEMGVPEEEAFTHLKNHHKFKAVYDEDVLRAIVSASYAEEKPKPHVDEVALSRETRRLIDFLTTRYVFRYNTVMGYPEFRPNNTWVQDWKPCDETVINGMTIKARLANLDVRDKDVRRYVHSDLLPQCDPIGDYLFRVSDKWDGIIDHISLLARCVPCDLPQWEQWFRKWFLSMVAQWLLPRQEYGNSVVPLLISSQGDGKSTFCRNILPKEFGWGFLENLDVREKRQTLQAMHNFLLINLDEFNRISPKDQEGFLKNVIQLPCVKIKRPYGKHVEEFRRYASFIATTNEGSVLSDPTGNRRFICVRLTAPINVDYKPNYEALYGQAYTIITKRLEQWWFTPEETKAIIENNRSFEIVPPAVQYFYEYFDVADDESDGKWMSPTAIYDRLRSIAGSGLKANGVSAFGRHLRNIPGIQVKRVTAGKAYLVKQKKQMHT